jgi:hypothetical protein
MRIVRFAVLLALVSYLIPPSIVGLELAAAEFVFIQKVMDDKAIVVRSNGTTYLIEKGVGCLSLWRYEGKRVLIDSPGLFLGVGSRLLIPEIDQSCRIWNAEEISSISPRPTQPPQSLNPPSQREELDTSEFDLYDSQGRATAFLDLSEGLTIYLWAGKPVAYLDGDSIYGFNGKHLGWYLKGIVYDQDGYIVLAPARAYSANVERAPPRGIKTLKPIKGLKDLKPLKPLFGLSWSKYPSWFFLAQGVVLTR